MITVLVADDEKGICDFIGDFFARRGHKVFTVSNPLKVLAVVEKERPNIVILDVVMPRLSGLDILKSIKSKYKDTKVIMVTVAEDQAIKEKALQLGADEYITKPFSTDFLETVVMMKIQELFSSKKQTVAR